MLYHSLHNKFLITERPLGDIPALCKKHGIDGVLIVSLGDKKPRVTIFNADGSDGGLCLNGARCVAHFLYTQKDFPTHFVIEMGDKKIETNIDSETACITQKVALGHVLGQKTKHGFTGHCVDVGNPHFVIFEKQTVEWLKSHGDEIDPQSNVEFVWGEGKKYHVVVHERGCGVTMACSSGAVAIATLLHAQKKLPPEEKIIFSMPGGELICWITQDKKVALQAHAYICTGQ